MAVGQDNPDKPPGITEIMLAMADTMKTMQEMTLKQQPQIPAIAPELKEILTP